MKHEFQPGRCVDRGRPDPRWCNVCGELRRNCTGSRPLPAPTTPDHPVSPVYGDPGGHSEGQER